jgi:hypothetical protein
MFTTSSSINRNSVRPKEHGSRFVPFRSTFFHVKTPTDSKTIHRALFHLGDIMRLMNAYASPDHLRLNADLPEARERLIKTLSRTLLELSGAL